MTFTEESVVWERDGDGREQHFRKLRGGATGHLSHTELLELRLELVQLAEELIPVLLAELVGLHLDCTPGITLGYTIQGCMLTRNERQSDALPSAVCVVRVTEPAPGLSSKKAQNDGLHQSELLLMTTPKLSRTVHGAQDMSSSSLFPLAQLCACTPCTSCQLLPAKRMQTSRLDRLR